MDKHTDTYWLLILDKCSPKLEFFHQIDWGKKDKRDPSANMKTDQRNNKMYIKNLQYQYLILVFRLTYNHREFSTSHI